MSIFNEEQIRQAIENFQRSHPAAFAYDISHIDSEESLEEMKNIIDNYIKKAEQDSEMHIIFEMAKQYLNGARPSYDKSKFVHVKLKHQRFGEVDAWIDKQRNLLFFDCITLELAKKYNWEWKED